MHILIKTTKNIPTIKIKLPSFFQTILAGKFFRDLPGRPSDLRDIPKKGIFDPTHTEMEWPEMNDNQQIIKDITINSGANIRVHKRNECNYDRIDDIIVIAHHHMFRDVNEYCSLILHEMAHWTGHKTRLNRTKGFRPSTWKAAYLQEELTADMTAFIIESICQINVGKDTQNSLAEMEKHARKTLGRDVTQMVGDAWDDAAEAAKYLLDFSDLKNVEKVIQAVKVYLQSKKAIG